MFASIFDPANPHFCTTLPRFMRFLRFRQDRVENDFKVNFDVPEAQKNTPKSTIFDREALNFQQQKNHQNSDRFFIENDLQNGPQNSQKIVCCPLLAHLRPILVPLGHTLVYFGPSRAHFGPLQASFWSLWGPILEPSVTKIYHLAGAVIKQRSSIICHQSSNHQPSSIINRPSFEINNHPSTTTQLSDHPSSIRARRNARSD